MYPVDASKASPNEFHIDEKGQLQPGLKETQHRILPSDANLREEFDRLSSMSEELVAAEAEVEARIQAAKDSLVGEQTKLQEERALFEKQRAEFEAEKANSRARK